MLPPSVISTKGGSSYLKTTINLKAGPFSVISTKEINLDLKTTKRVKGKFSFALSPLLWYTACGGI